ncbi:MAG: CPBP family intramembrane metalloprotease [Pirellulaceae bacterium]|nr:CPBP family intramembrane metalloprotease [Pirellulaceae bacterium]
MPEDQYIIEYVPNDRHSEWALQLLRSVFGAINDEVSKQVVRIAGAELHPRITMSAAPVQLPSSTPTTLASLVPLVLVLMTIAGAVYPAIDLTAGERERGTLEAMIVSPTPRSILLLAKYVAVVTVALLTAIANLMAMSITLWASGLGRMVLGGGGLSFSTVSQIFCLLVLFAMFFSAVLLSITSFAKSFKEAQAYLIPVMLVSLAPGVLSLLPQVRLTNFLAAVPLANIVLLSRDVLIGTASREAGVIAVVCTMIYAIAAIAVASRLFGSDASLQGSQGSWRDFVRRPDQTADAPTVDQMALTMACLFPLYFVASTSLPMLGGGLEYRLVMASAISWLLIFGLPTWVARYRRLNFTSTFLLSTGRPTSWIWLLPGILLLAGSLWMISHELMIFSQQLGLATFTPEQMKKAQAFADKMPSVPLALLLFTGALTPAICEEWFFRGFVMSALRRFGFATAVIGSALLFGLMHVLTSNVLSLERLLPSLFMGLVLGMIAWRTKSLWPGVWLHAGHNGLLLSIGHYKAELTELGIGVQEGGHLPIAWLAGGALAIAVGSLLIRR